MTYAYKAKCPHCGYSIDYRPDTGVDYHYRGLSKYSEYPKIEFAWCNDCNKFTQVQLGINAQKTKENINSQYKKLIQLEKSLIKPIKTKIEIEQLKIRLFDSVILNALIEGRDTHASCIECGNFNVVFKDIENQIWRCPKCKKSFLTLEKEEYEDDILYRRGEKAILPKSRFYDYVNNIVRCSIDTINNEGVYYIIHGDADMLSVLSKKTSYIDRMSLTYSVITTLLNKQIHKETFIRDLIEFLLEMEFLTEDTKSHIIDRLNEKIEYFISEIEIEMKCSAFIPTTIIKTLMSPTEPSRRNITGVNPFEAIKHWKIIIDTIQGYFPNI